MHAAMLPAVEAIVRQSVSFLGFVVVAFQGVEMTVGWCTNGKCPRSRPGTYLQLDFAQGALEATAVDILLLQTES